MAAYICILIVFKMLSYLLFVHELQKTGDSDPKVTSILHKNKQGIANLPFGRYEWHWLGLIWNIYEVTYYLSYQLIRLKNSFLPKNKDIMDTISLPTVHTWNKCMCYCGGSSLSLLTGSETCPLHCANLLFSYRKIVKFRTQISPLGWPRAACSLPKSAGGPQTAASSSPPQYFKLSCLQVMQISFLFVNFKDLKSVLLYWNVYTFRLWTFTDIMNIMKWDKKMWIDFVDTNKLRFLWNVSSYCWFLFLLLTVTQSKWPMPKNVLM